MEACPLATTPHLASSSSSDCACSLPSEDERASKPGPMELAHSSDSDEEALWSDPTVGASAMDVDDSASACLLPSDDSQDGGPSQTASRAWQPGQNMGHWGDRQSDGLSTDAQMMLCNVVLRCKRLRRDTLDAVLSDFQLGCQGTGFSKADQISASFLCLSFTTVRRYMQRMLERNWAPAQPARRSNTRDIGVQTGDGCETENLVRLSLAGATEGRSLRGYERDVARMLLSGGQCGDKSHTRKFAVEAQHVGANLLRLLDAQDINRMLPGLGIPSDLAIVFDPVSLGSGMFTKHGSVLMLAVALVSAETLGLYAPMVDAPVMGLESHTGPALRDRALQALGDHVAGLSVEA